MGSRTPARAAMVLCKRCRSSRGSPGIGNIVLTIRGFAENFDTFHPLATRSQWCFVCVSMFIFWPNFLVVTESRHASCSLSDSLVQGDKGISNLGIWL